MAEVELKMERLPRSLELIESDDGLKLRYIDERALPYELLIVETSSWEGVVDAIKTLAIRGAPAIGLAGASALALWSWQTGVSHSSAAMCEVAETIASARPTAVNLRWAVEGALDEVVGLAGEDVARALFDFAKKLEFEDEAANRLIGSHGAKLLGVGSRILTHCNAGSLATSYFGTALGVVYTAAGQGRVARVYADETRPVGQGARLTAWELSRVGIPVTLICDNMAASLMAKGSVDAVIVGADRIARNGDAANKIGTYGVAVLAREHGIPFYVAAPTSSVDLSIRDGSEIVIEQRDPSEVLARPIPGVDVWNPAFDVTPARLITRIITEKGAFSPGELAVNMGCEGK